MTIATEEIQEIQTEDQKTLEVTAVLRTRRDGVFHVYDGPWGSYIRATDDPEANVEISEDHLKKFELREDIYRIPADLWARWVKLCFYYVDKVPNSVEVSIRILRSEEDPSKYRFLVPMQKVSGASVRVDSFDLAVDIETGEEIQQYPPVGWIPVGSSHSHNTMNAFFSGIDDKYELDDPGIHLVIGSVDTTNMKYAIAASVVGSHRRFEVPYDKLVDATPVPDIEFNSKVLDYVDWSVPTYPVGKSSIISYPTKWTKKESKQNNIVNQYHNLGTWGWDIEDDSDYSDPFYWKDDFTSSCTNGDEVKEVKLWNVIDTLNDYLKVIDGDLNRINNLREELGDFMNDLEVILDTELNLVAEVN
jgi:hypothetical protein